jgi:hypothetical protein
MHFMSKVTQGAQMQPFLQTIAKWILDFHTSIQVQVNVEIVA